MTTTFIGPTISTFNLCGFPFSTLVNDYTLLMFYLSYYSIAQYFRLLQVKLMSTCSQDIEPWKGLKTVLTHLYEASAAFNSIFSIPALYIVTSRLIIISSHLFVIIYYFIKKSTPTAGFTLILSTDIAISLIYLLTVLHAADMHIYQVVK